MLMVFVDGAALPAKYTAPKEVNGLDKKKVVNGKTYELLGVSLEAVESGTKPVLKTLTKTCLVGALFSQQARKDLSAAYTGKREVAIYSSSDFLAAKTKADRGDTDSQNYVGVMLLEGRRVRGNDEEAARYFLMAAQKGHADAQCNLGYMHNYGYGVVKSQDLAIEWYMKSVENGSIVAISNLAILFHDIKNYQKAYEFAKKGTDKKNPICQYILGSLLENGRGVKQNLDLAAHYYAEADSQGDQDAREALCNLRAKRLNKAVTKIFVDSTALSANHSFPLEIGGFENEKKIKDKTYTLLGVSEEKVSRKGRAWVLVVALAKTIICLGIGVIFSQGTRNNWKTVFSGKRTVVVYTSSEFLRTKIKADRGDVASQANVGYMLAEGKDVKKDEVEAVRYYIMAAEKGDMVAQNNLGVMYKGGRGVVQSDAQAIRWYTFSANQGNVTAMRNLAIIYMKEIKDDQKAYEFAKMGADRGDATCQLILGSLLLLGAGVKMDVGLGATYYAKAAAQGNEKARKALHDLVEGGHLAAAPEKPVAKPSTWARIAALCGKKAA